MNATTVWNGATSMARRVDVAMLAAAVVEVPRWYVAFAAINEPPAAAVSMGLLLAWGASAGWKSYFENRRRVMLLAINVVSLVGALFVIAPVIYAMTFTPLEDVDLSLILDPFWLAVWAAVLAITTFVPLIQLAAVSMYRTQPAQESEQPAKQSEQPAKESEQPAKESEQPAPQQRRTRQPAPGVTTPEQRRAQIVELELTDTAQIVELFGGSLRRAQLDLQAIREQVAR